MYNLNNSDAAILITLALLCFYYFSLKNILLKKTIVFIFLLVSSIIVGFRPVNAGFDTYLYIKGYYIVGEANNFLEISTEIKNKLGIGNDFGFWLIAYIFNIVGLSSEQYLYINALISISILYFGLYKIFSQNTLIYLLAFLVCGTFYNTYGNAIRQAYVLSLLPFLIYSRFINYKFISCLIIIMAMFLFHKDSAILIFIFFIATYFQKKYLFIFYLLSFIFSLFIEKYLPTYINASIYTQSSSVLMHPAFILLNLTLFISLIFMYTKTKYKKSNNDVENYIFHPFLIFTSFSVLFSFNEFTYNRIANFAYFLQVMLIFNIILSSFKFKNTVAFFMIIISILWGISILNTNSVSLILNGK